MHAEAPKLATWTLNNHPQAFGETTGMTVSGFTGRGLRALSEPYRSELVTERAASSEARAMEQVRRRRRRERQRDRDKAELQRTLTPAQIEEARRGSLHQSQQEAQQRAQVHVNREMRGRGNQEGPDH